MSAARTYLDHNATSPLRPEAREAVIAALDAVGNASSVHAEGRQARGIVETAREQVARLVGARSEQVVFTSGATEANTWVMRAGWDTIAVAGIEHESVLAPARTAGARLVEVPCPDDGRVIVGALARLLAAGRTGRALVSLQAANSETGVLQPVEEAAREARAHGFISHTDAVQLVGKLPVSFAELGVDLMSISAHKLGGPKGIGALVIRDGLDLPALIQGGGQERRRRSGTENVAAIAGFGAAAEASRTAPATSSALRDLLESRVLALTPDAVVIGAGVPRLPNTSCIALPGQQAATLLIKLDLAGIAVSAGAACSSGKIGGSHVLAAMGVPRTLAEAAIRVSVGWTTTRSDIDAFLAAWGAIHRARRPRGEQTPKAGAVTGRREHEMRAGE